MQLAQSVLLLLGMHRGDLPVRDSEPAKGLEIAGNVFWVLEAGEANELVPEAIDPPVHLEREIFEGHTLKR